MISTRSVVVFLSVLFVSLGVFAGELERSDLQEAQATVKRYQELRKICAVSRGLARKDCFSALRDANPEYKDAKSLLAEQNVDGDANHHFVTYVN